MALTQRPALVAMVSRLVGLLFPSLLFSTGLQFSFPLVPNMIYKIMFLRELRQFLSEKRGAHEAVVNDLRV